MHYRGGYAVGWRVFSTEEHTISSQYGGDTPPMQTRVCSTDLSHHQYSGGSATWISYIISIDEGVQYRTTKTTQGAVGGCVYLGEGYFTNNLTVTWILSYCYCI